MNCKIFVIGSIENPSYFARHTECVVLISKTLEKNAIDSSTEHAQVLSFLIPFILLYIIIISN